MSYWTELAAFELSNILTPHSHFSQFSLYTDSSVLPPGAWLQWVKGGNGAFPFI